MDEQPRADRLPPGAHLERTTPAFDETTVPPGLLREHRIAEGVWGRLVVYSGALTLHFDDGSGEVRRIASEESAVIAPTRPHHVEFDGPASFAVEFYR